MIIEDPFLLAVVNNVSKPTTVIVIEPPKGRGCG
jgi:hypothetical protein